MQRLSFFVLLYGGQGPVPFGVPSGFDIPPSPGARYSASARGQ